MFKKLVSNIPFNPSLIDQIPAYRSSLKKELRLRYLGLTIFLLAILAQVFISLFPAQSTLASSPNDLITGGFSNRAQLISDCNNNYQSYQTILAYYSISCGSLSSNKIITIHPDSYNKQLFSLNRLSYGQSDETNVIIGQQNYFMRPLDDGNWLSATDLEALSGTSLSGAKYLILYNSGDLAFINQPAVQAICNPLSSNDCPVLSVTARDSQSNNVSGQTVKPGDTIIYTLAATNQAKYPITNYKVGANFSSALTYSRVANLYGGSISNGYISWPGFNLLPHHSIVKSVSLAIISPVSKTPLSSTDANYYNLKTVTTYGNSITIRLPWSFSKFFELKINNYLPSLSARFSLVICLLICLIVIYFSYRTRLLLKELDIVKEDYLNGGKD